MCVCNKNIYFENYIKNAVCDFLTHERERQREFFYLSAFSPIPFSLLADISG